MSERGEAVRAAMEVALRDFQHPTPVDLHLGVDERHGDELVWVSKPEGGSSGFWVQDGQTDEETLVQVADHLQDQVFDLLEQTWGEARPPCPGHQHQLYPTLVDGQAWWRCPHTDRLHARIGTLSPT